MTEFICQSWERAGVFNAAMTTDESPSKEKVSRSRETAKEAASASPKFALHGGLIWERALRICLWEYLQTTACTENCSWIAMSKFTLKDTAGGGDQCSIATKKGEFQAAACWRVVFLMEFARALMSGFTPSWKALFLENQRRSQRTAAKIWKRREYAKGIPREEKWFIMPLIQFGRGREDQAREFKGQNEFLQATQANIHLKKIWDRESSSVVQRGRETPIVRWEKWISIWLLMVRYPRQFS